MAKILLADDDALVLYTLAKVLRHAGHEVFTAEDGQQAEKMLAEDAYDLLITDIIMPNKVGLEVISVQNYINPTLPIIAITGGGRDLELGKSTGDILLEKAKAHGAEILKKPFSNQQLLDCVDALLESSSA